MNNYILKIYKSLLSGIIDGKYQPGSLLPPETVIAKEFGTNRMNANFAIKRLEKNGLVTRKKRVGTTINPDIEMETVQMLFKEANRSIYIIYSMTPHWVHWNESSFAGLEKEVEPEGYSVTYRNIPTGQQREEYKDLLQEVVDNEASALVIFPDTEDTAFMRENADLLRDLQIPVFMLNRSGEPLPIDMVSFVSMDPFGEGVQIGELLRKNNCSDVIMLTSYDSFWGRKRLEGVKFGMKLGQRDCCDKFQEFLACEEKYAHVAELIKSSDSEIVIVAANNEFASKFIKYVKTRGLKVSDDYKLVTFDDNPLYKADMLTSLGVPTEEVGHIMGKLICDKSWLSNYRRRISIKIKSQLIVRNTFVPAKVQNMSNVLL